MTEWRWVELDVVLAIHDRQLALYGGLDGVLNLGSVEAALARPKHLAAYEAPDVAGLAAAYTFGLARNHGFADGNKRTAWHVTRIFIADNGFMLRHEAIETIQVVQGVAGGSVSESDLATWLRARIVGR